MSSINDYIRPTDYGYVRKDINKILALVHDITAQEPEDEGLQERICISSSVKLRTTSVIIGEPNFLDTLYRDKQSFVYRKVIPSSVYTYDLSHTTTGTLTFSTDSTKYGGAGTFDGSSYITIADHARMDTSYVSLGGWFYLPATDSGDTLAQNLIGKGTSFQLTIDPHATAANQIRAISQDIEDSNALTETGVTIQTEDSLDLELTKYVGASVVGTFTPNAWNHIIMTRGAVNLKLYINNVLISTDTSMDGVILPNTNDLIIG
tara:strand:+ start:1663 stop:2451 length:789 start_codon:yes stop_codon:yes gene_type:complete